MKALGDAVATEGGKVRSGVRGDASNVPARAGEEVARSFRRLAIEDAVTLWACL